MHINSHIRGGTRESFSFSLAAMFSAFALIFLYLASLLPGFQLILFFLSSVFVMGIMLEEHYGMAILSFAVVSILGFLILPDKTLLFPFLLFYGHYGIAKYLIEKKNKKTPAMVLKFLYFNVALLLLYFLARTFFLAQIPFDLPLIAFFIVMQAVFVLYDYLFSKISIYYYEKIRKRLMGSHY